MKVHRLACIAFYIFATTACAQQEKQVYVPPQPQPKAGKNEVVVNLSPTKIERPGTINITFDANGHPSFIEPKPVKMVKGELNTDGEDVIFYLPAYGPYSVNSKKSHSFENTSTAISVDSNNNSELERTELWFSSMPIRFGDKMFEVKKIDPGSTWVLLSKSSAPLSGLVVGKPCPPFTFTMADGKQIKLEDYKGKSLLLDVWSMT